MSLSGDWDGQEAFHGGFYALDDSREAAVFSVLLELVKDTPLSVRLVGVDTGVHASPPLVLRATVPL